MGAHTGDTDRMLAMIRDHGQAFARDLAADCGITQTKAMDLLERKVDAGLIERGVGYREGGRRQMVLYTWVGRNPAKATKMGPCLGGCGTQIVRDGVTFMCSRCRSAAASASPYAA